MAKRHKTGHEQRTEGPNLGSPATEGADKAPQASNQLLQEQLRGADARGSVEAPPSALFGVVERAMLALQIAPRPQAEIDRFVEVVERSHLPDGRKVQLLERIEGDQEAALGVREALEAWFSEDTPELRGALDDVLDRVWSGLEAGADPGSLSELAASASAGDLAPWLEASASTPDEAVAGFCRQIASLWLWGGDEEEEEDPAHYPAVEI